eukprot:976445-Rhodomonas_salina.7
MCARHSVHMCETQCAHARDTVCNLLFGTGEALAQLASLPRKLQKQTLPPQPPPQHPPTRAASHVVNRQCTCLTDSARLAMPVPDIRS